MPGMAVTIAIRIVQILVGAALMEVTFFGTAYRASDERGGTNALTVLFIIASAAGAIFLGWYWCALWLVPFAIRLAVFRGKTDKYAPEPDEIKPDYGKFADFRGKSSAPLPRDAKLEELVKAGKNAEAREHAREMMAVARSVGDRAREEEYARWLAG